MERPRPSVHEQADQVVEKKIETASREAFQHAIDKVHGRGCMCKNCLGTAKTEANSWADFQDPEGNYPRFEHDGSRMWLEEDES